MKTVNKHILLAAALLTAFASCTSYDADDKKFDNVAYLDVSQTSSVQPATIKKTVGEAARSISVLLAYPSSEDVTVSVAADPSLAARYNARYGTQWPVLDPKYYELSGNQVTIPAGKTVSESLTLLFKGLQGEGAEETGALPLDETYLLPVTITHSPIAVLQASSTAYYVVKRSSNITTAALLKDNWIEFPTLDKYSDGSKAWNGLTAITYEALIYIDDFATSRIDAGGAEQSVVISSVIGVEQYLLLRIGDAKFERRQLQFDGSGSGSAFGKFPETNPAKNLEKGRWYHVACTYDQSTRTVCIYVDGKIQSEGTDMGVPGPGSDNEINLAMRALYDLYTQNPGVASYEKYAGFADAYQFFIGRSYDDYRPMNGKIAEARVWSVARTPEQIWENMYEIAEPQQDPTLLGYWKFNDGAGNTVKDYSQYGNDGVAKNNLEWPAGIEIPKINE